MREADAVLNATAGEANIRQSICQLLTALGYDDYLLEHETGAGRADIFLPRHRTIIETKDRGSADFNQSLRGSESPLDQLSRYVRAKIEDEWNAILYVAERVKWTGIVTDGQVWHHWSFENRFNASPQEERLSFEPVNGRELADWLRSALAKRTIGKPWIPKNPAELFEPWSTKLHIVYESLGPKVERETKTKLSLWRDMLRSSGMEPEAEIAQVKLFVTHSFLIALARGVVWTLENPKEVEPNIEALLDEGIVSWIAQTQKGRQWARSLFRKIAEYDWRQRKGDVLRPLYEAFVANEDRRDFGEVYTPDWLAEMLTRRILDDDWCKRAIIAVKSEIYSQKQSHGIGMLDPCCGSGTFLYHAVRRIMCHSEMEQLDDARKAEIVCRLVSGIDIHPVACEFARATMLRALPVEPSGGQSSLRIWNGDSLMLQSEVGESLFAPRNGAVVFLSPAGKKVELPESFVNHQKFSEILQDMTRSAAKRVSLPSYVEDCLPAESDRQTIRESFASLTAIIEKEGNSVWAWFIQQTLGPYKLARQKVDRIVSNPPWVRMSTIQHSGRKRLLEGFARESDLWEGGNQAPNTDIAQFFIKRCRQRYLNEPDNPAAWVVKHSAIKSGQWGKFRSWREEKDLFGQILDLTAAQVFGGGDARKTCVLIDNLADGFRPLAPVITARCHDKRPNAASSLAQAEELLEWIEAPAGFLEGESGYMGAFRSGATVNPHVLVLAQSFSRRENSVVITTRRSKQPPWKSVESQNVEVPNNWLLPLLRSDHLLPFALAPDSPDFAIIPLHESGETIENATMALQNRDWRRLDEIWRELKGRGQHTPRDLLSQIDHIGKATCQLPLGQVNQNAPKCRLLYPGSGDRMRACTAPEGGVVLDSTLFYGTFESAAEAAYLASVLNAPSLMLAFKQSRRSGRHFQLHPWRRVPIPRFNDQLALHRDLANVSERSQQIVDNLLSRSNDMPSSQVGKSRRIREHLTKVRLFEELNELVTRLMPDQVA